MFNGKAPSLPEVVGAVCRLPIDFHGGNASAVELVRRSGYTAVRDEVTVDQLFAHLSTHPELVNAWMTWSEDNRSTPAWYVEELGPSEFEVGYYDDARRSQVRFNNRTRASAEFIRRYLEQVVP